MKALIQRTTGASVKAEDKVIGKIGAGLVVLLGITHSDSEKEIDYLVQKILNLRLFPGQKSGFDTSVLEEKKEILIVSQFTLYGSCKKGRRPDFGEAARPEQAEGLYNQFVEKLKETGVKVETGKFGADMKVSLINDGPVTIMLES